MGEENKQKVYIETSFVSYLTGLATTREPVAVFKRYMEDIGHDD